MKPYTLLIAILLTPVGAAATTSFLVPPGYDVTAIHPATSETHNTSFEGYTLLEVTRNGTGTIAVLASNGTHNLSWIEYVIEPHDDGNVLMAIDDAKAGIDNEIHALQATVSASHNTTKDYLYDELVRTTDEIKDKINKESLATRSKIPVDPWPATRERFDQLTTELQPVDPGQPWITWLLLVAGFGAVLAIQFPRTNKTTQEPVTEDDGIILDMDE